MKLFYAFAILLSLGKTRGQLSSLPTCSGSNPDPTDCILDHVTMKVEQLATFNSAVIKKTNEFEKIVLRKIDESCSSSANLDQTLVKKIDDMQSTTATRDETLFKKVQEIQSDTATRENTLLQKVEELLSIATVREETLIQKVQETQADAASREQALLNKLDEMMSATANRDNALLQKVENMLSSSDIRDKINTLECIATDKSNCGASHCLELFNTGNHKSGIYTIYAGQEPIRVFCDMDTSHGGPGWTLFQQRKDGSVSFNRTWEDYRFGFGKLDGEHWLGNRNLALITQSHQTYQLRIDMWDWNDAHKYAQYSSVRIFNETEKYKLIFGSYSGDAGDSMIMAQNNSRFSTPDRDNDHDITRHCAQCCYWSGWWFDQCTQSGLNNPYHSKSRVPTRQGVRWDTWHGTRYSLKKVQMKIRPVLN